MSFEQIQVGEVSDNIGRNGQVISPSHMNDEQNYPITTGRAKQVWQYIVDATPDTGDVININALGESGSLTIASETQEQAVDALVLALNANPIIRGVFTASKVSTTTVRLTANNYGTDVTVTVTGTGAADGTFTGETVATASATQIGVGIAVYHDGSGGITVTNPNSGDLTALAGFTRNILDAEQTGIASLDTDLYEDNEDVVAMKRCEMIVDTGDTANQNDRIWIEQAAGTTLGKAYAASGSTGQTLVITPTAVNAFDYQVDLIIDGVPVNLEYTSDGTATVAEITAGLHADAVAKTDTSLLTSVDGTTVVTFTLTDADADMAYNLSDNLAGVQDDGTTRLELAQAGGVWSAANKIELRGGF